MHISSQQTDSLMKKKPINDSYNRLNVTFLPAVQFYVAPKTSEWRKEIQFHQLPQTVREI